MLNALDTIPLIDLMAVSHMNYDQTSGLSILDQRGRPLRDLRISLTDRCNFRCVYCMPREVFSRDHAYLPSGALLSFEEIERLARLFVSQGVEKIRLTGGEPLIRKNIESLIERLASIRTLSGNPLDLTLTTNGSLLARKAKGLRDAGLSRVTVSLDALDDLLFQRMNDVGYPLASVLDGIEQAQAVGLTPLKINMVVKRGTNEQEVLPMARYFRSSGIILRFIEYMDVGTSNGWNMGEVMPSEQIISQINHEFPLRPLEPTVEGETAQRWAYADGSGEVGFIASVTGAFCGSCTRARLSADGKLYLCLFASAGHDLRALIHGGMSDQVISGEIASIWRGRSNRYSELRRSEVRPHTGRASGRIEMSYVGG
ncbi:GTP 3',8-cyclase MoaA [Pseudomonas sp. NPDC088368]|uniref:GTP 3',8-cyclase MoaA n=1 Tax=Pseudomonas sp. NPDC088368 TaxID=3364453 RepID=UPI003807D69F